MISLIVLDNPKKFPLEIPAAAGPNVEVVAAADYVTHSKYSVMRRAKVYNLCRSYKYQTLGYYVSLLAQARGHRPLPSIKTIQDLRMQPIVRIAAQDADKLLQTAFKGIRSDHFDLSIYFGRNMAKRYDRLASALFNQFPAPFLRATFRRHDEESWELESLRVIALSDIPEPHRPFAAEMAQRYFANPTRAPRSPKPTKYDMAILVDPDEKLPPSDPAAIEKFTEAAEDQGFSVELIEREDFGRVAEFDALFIRVTTAVNHFSYRFARRAAAEGLVVIDDPDSIVRCTNKVFLAELLERHRLRAPKTVIFAEANASLVAERIGFPCVVKQPDGSFSTGVKKFETHEAFDAGLPQLFEQSELLLAQEFVPTPFDWRVGVLDGEPLYVCKYHMARAHWQIIKHDESGGAAQEGVVDTFRVEAAPEHVVQLGVRAAKAIGSGLYGVDIKEVRGRPMVIEINDNPSIDHGFEDKALGDELYRRIMQHFVAKLDERRAAAR